VFRRRERRVTGALRSREGVRAVRGRRDLPVLSRQIHRRRVSTRAVTGRWQRSKCWV